MFSMPNRARFSSKPIGSNGPPYQRTMSRCCSCAESRTASRKSMKPSGPPTSSGGQRLPAAPARRQPMARRLPASARTRESLSDLIEGRLSSADGRAALVKLATRLDRRGGVGGREPRCPRPRLLRARGISRPGLAQRRAHGSSEDGGRAGGLCAAADRRARETVPLGDPGEPEGPHPGVGRPSGGASDTGLERARHQGRVPGRERTAVAVADGGFGDHLIRKQFRNASRNRKISPAEVTVWTTPRNDTAFGTTDDPSHTR